MLVMWFIKRLPVAQFPALIGSSVPAVSVCKNEILDSLCACRTNMPRNSPSVSHLKACFEQHPLVYLPFLQVHHLLSLYIPFSILFGFLF